MRAYRLMTAPVALLLTAGGVHAQQEFPAKPIRLIVPAASGDGPDPAARMLALRCIDPADGSPQRFHEFLKREVAKWQNVVKRAGIRPGR